MFYAAIPPVSNATPDLWEQVVRSIADGVPSLLGALFGIWIAAILAFRNWRKQLAMSQRHDIAFRYTNALMTIRANLGAVRNPLIDLREGYSLGLAKGEDLSKITDRKARENQAMALIWDSRYQQISKPLVDAYSASIELEALGDPQLRAKADDVGRQINKLYHAIRLLLEDRRSRDVSIDMLEKSRKIVYQHHDDPKEDPFVAETEEKIDLALTAAKRHLFQMN
ncbi:MAG: hypothetical protein LAT64_07480 [Phycisphaerales bacterium]|nr:hypothetical protein [Planctomycetota bacterium]MCH8508597.1 hypothetical protein [Phycisphaerales bacterium]